MAGSACSRELSLNKFFHQRSSSMRKDCAEKLVENTSLAAPGALAYRLQRHAACNT